MRNWDAGAINKNYMAHAVPLGLSKKIAKRSLCNCRCAIGIVEKDCQKKSSRCAIGIVEKIAKRSLCNSRCAIGIVEKDCQKKSV